MKQKLCIFFLFLFLLTGCFSPGEPGRSPSPGEQEPSADSQTDPDASSQPSLQELQEQSITALLASMSLEEKVGQLFFVRCPSENVIEDIQRYHLGGLLLFGRDYQNASGDWLSADAFTAKIQQYQSSSEIPLFIGSDEEGGTVTRATRNPNLFSQKAKSPQWLYENGGMDAIIADAAEKNQALLALGINVNFAPVCDVSTNPDDFIYQRTLGQDASATSDYTKAVVTQMKNSGICSVLKHFPGYGNNLDTHTGVAIDERPYEQFTSSDLLPFQAGISAGADFVLISHNIVTSMDASLPASLSPEVHQILRDECNFSGLAITDDLAMDAVEAYAENGDAAVLAFLAGNDMIITTDYQTQIPQVIEAVQNGTLEEAVVNRCVQQVLRIKLEHGILPLGA